MVGLLILSPELLEQKPEAVAWLSFTDPQLDRARNELLKLATSHERLDTSTVENHLVSQGLGVLAERLKADRVLVSDVTGQIDGSGRESLFERMRAQLEHVDSTGLGQLQERRDRALTDYLQRGAGDDWDELQRLNNEIRAHLERMGNGI